MSSDVDSLPAVSYFDIVNYFINSKSAYTMDELNAVKSMDSFNHCYNGWVKDVRTLTKNERILVKGRVRHSQRMNDTPLTPWAIVRIDGFVESAHCNCMAGLGEVCSHIGALLFWVEATHRANANLTVTQKKAYWPVPSYVDKVQYLEVKDIDFSSAEKKVKDLNHLLCSGEKTPKRALQLPKVEEPTLETEQHFSHVLSLCKSKPAVLAVKENFQENYIPDILRKGKLPISLGTFRDEKFMNMEREELISECAQLEQTLTVTCEQAKNAEIITKQQFKCKEWHAFRHGRITASNVKLVCSGLEDKPALSTVKAICGTGSRFTNKATEWGIAHEREALLKYRRDVSPLHDDLKVDNSGLFISPAHPHLGASPDGIVSCSCCGDGLVEIKCPYSVKDGNVKDLEYLDKNMALKHQHKYMYQVQTQLLVTNKLYCEFVIWTKDECLIQRIEPLPVIQEEIVKKTTSYFKNVILLELTGSLISRERTLMPNNSNKTVTEPSSSQASEIICVCQKPYKDGEDVIGCDNQNCPYVWLHFKCINLTKVPRGKFYCNECRNKRPAKKSKHC
ncbi:uncharacterized protein LOC132737860 [Ruditapes philippinarum]|uniref:uncharacterized protein LOC132737860 n=1 Tax=Ruditapes philippinarum TaxID=129788 RepID=UPI00295B044F|nr:uncharacterized protein LOC132737860 [Ruditapes philippinarum]